MFKSHPAIVSVLAVGVISMSAAPQKAECDRQALFLSRRPYFTVRWRDYCVASFIILTGFLQIQGFVTFDSKYWQPVPGSDGSLNGTYELPTWVHAHVSVKL